MRALFTATTVALAYLVILPMRCLSESVNDRDHKKVAPTVLDSKECARWVGVYVPTDTSGLVKKITIMTTPDGSLKIRASLNELPDEITEHDGIATPYSPLGRDAKRSLITKFNSGKFRPILVVVDRSSRSSVSQEKITTLSFSYSMRDIDGSAMRATGTLKREVAGTRPRIE